MKKKTIVVLVLIGIIIFLVYFPGNKLFPKTAPLTLQQRTSNDLSESILRDDDTILGEPNAPILIVEFGDFMCQFCGEVHRIIEPLWRQEYIETGKAQYIFRDFVALTHPPAFVAAEANECADVQGKQWLMYDLLFDNAYRGDIWSQRTDKESLIEVMKKYAQQLDLDLHEFERCMLENNFGDEVQQDKMVGFQMGVTGTPTIYIGNDQAGFTKVRGLQPYAVYKQIIDQKLNVSKIDHRSI